MNKYESVCYYIQLSMYKQTPKTNHYNSATIHLISFSEPPRILTADIAHWTLDLRKKSYCLYIRV